MRQLPPALEAVAARVNGLLNIELSSARWFGAVVGVTCLLLGLCGLSVYIIDPYCRYHTKPIVGPVYDDEYRMIPNILDTADYDSLVAGTSMCLNFSLKDVRDLLKWEKPIKITASGCRPATFKLFCDKAFKNRKIGHVLTTLDVSILAKERGSHFVPLEPFLYSRSLLHECAYLFNADIVFSANRNVIKAHRKHAPRLNPDIMFCSDDGSGKVRYGKDRVMEAMHGPLRRTELQWVRDLRQRDQAELATHMMSIFDESYMAVIKAHPETEFLVFYAPYSYLCWGGMLQEGMLDFLLDIKARTARELLAQPNVKLFDFQTELTVVTNLANYRDTSHFKPAINRLIVERVAAGENRCGPDTVDKNAETIRTIARQGDIDLR